MQPATPAGCARSIHLAAHRIFSLAFHPRELFSLQGYVAAFPKNNGGFQRGALPKTALNQPINPAASAGDNEVYPSQGSTFSEPEMP